MAGGVQPTNDKGQQLAPRRLIQASLMFVVFDCSNPFSSDSDSSVSCPTSMTTHLGNDRIHSDPSAAMNDEEFPVIVAAISSVSYDAGFSTAFLRSNTLSLLDDRSQFYMSKVVWKSRGYPIEHHSSFVGANSSPALLSRGNSVICRSVHLLDQELYSRSIESILDRMQAMDGNLAEIPLADAAYLRASRPGFSADRRSATVIVMEDIPGDAPVLIGLEKSNSEWSVVMKKRESPAIECEGPFRTEMEVATVSESGQEGAAATDFQSD